MEDTLSKLMSESAKRLEENSNLIKEIRALTDAGIRNQGASIKTLEIQIGKMSKVLQERGFGSLPSSTEANPRDQLKSISTTIEANLYPIRRIRSSQYACMTRSSKNEIFTPFKDPEREFRSYRKHFKTLSLDELRSPDFNLFSDQENSKEEVAETIAKTMEQYMIKTRADYGSGVTRPKIEYKDNFELKGQFLKELRTNTFSGSDHEDANEHIEKVLEIVDLFHIINITIDQVMLRAFPMSLTRFAGRWLRNEPTENGGNQQLSTRTDKNLYQAWERFKELLMKSPQHYLTEMQEVILFYNELGIPTRQILDSRGAIPSKTDADVKVAIQEMAEYSQKWHNGTSRSRSTGISNGLAAIQAQLNNLAREIKKVNEKVYAAQVGCE
ncbi:hypothetical protein Tco_0667826 [Tanacetum coccineum]